MVSKQGTQRSIPKPAPPTETREARRRALERDYSASRFLSGYVVDLQDEVDKAFTRGYIAATAEFARRQIKPAHALAAAGITRDVAIAAKPLRFDLDAIEEHFPRSKKG